MKTDMPELLKALRLSIRPLFKSIVDNDLSREEQDKALTEVEAKSLQIIAENGYAESEFYQLQAEYFMDFSSDNPDEWIIKHDPENARIISGN